MINNTFRSNILIRFKHYKNSFECKNKEVYRDWVSFSLWSHLNIKRNYLEYSSHRRCSVKKGVLRNLAKFTGKHLCQRFFFNKVAGIRPATLLKKSLWHRCFPVNFAKFLRTLVLQNTFGRLLLSATSPKSYPINNSNFFQNILALEYSYNYYLLHSRVHITIDTIQKLSIKLIQSF